MKEKKVIGSRRRNGFLLLLLPYFSIAGELINNGMIDFQNYLTVAFINTLITTAIMVIVPLLFRLFNGSELPYQKGRKICFINSIVLFMVSFFLNITMDVWFVGGLGAIVYYFVNMFWFVLPEDFSPTVEENRVEKEKVETKMYSFSRSFVVIFLIIIIFMAGVIEVFIYLYYKDSVTKLQEENEYLNVQNGDYSNEIERLKKANTEYRDTIYEKNNKISSMQKKVDFMDMHVVIVPANTHIFHKYDCEYLDVSSGGLVYNPENAKAEGFVPCSSCIK